MAEDNVIRKRLTVEGDSGQDDKRLAGLLKTFLKWCTTDNLSLEENEATYQKIMFTLSQVNFAFSRSEQVMSMNKQEEELYDGLATQVQDEIKQMKQKITESKEELIKACEVRQHRQQYDAMATIIQQHPDRAASIADIKSVEQNLERVNGQIIKLAEQLDSRRKQGSVLVLAIQQLLDTVNKDSEMLMET